MMAVSGATMQSAAEACKARIEAHGEQSLRARGDQPEPADFWSTLAAGFRADPRRRDDPVVNLLAEWITPETTVLDVGGDAGRYALPLALRCRRVTVVEPSPSMVAQLREGAKEAGRLGGREGRPGGPRFVRQRGLRSERHRTVPAEARREGTRTGRDCGLDGRATFDLLSAVEGRARGRSSRAARAPGTASGALGDGHLPERRDCGRGTTAFDANL